MSARTCNPPTEKGVAEARHAATRELAAVTQYVKHYADPEHIENSDEVCLGICMTILLALVVWLGAFLFISFTVVPHRSPADELKHSMGFHQPKDVFAACSDGGDTLANLSCFVEKSKPFLGNNGTTATLAFIELDCNRDFNLEKGEFSEEGHGCSALDAHGSSTTTTTTLTSTTTTITSVKNLRLGKVDCVNCMSLCGFDPSSSQCKGCSLSCMGGGKPKDEQSDREEDGDRPAEETSHEEPSADEPSEGPEQNHKHGTDQTKGEPSNEEPEDQALATSEPPPLATSEPLPPADSKPSGGGEQVDDAPPPVEVTMVGPLTLDEYRSRWGNIGEHAIVQVVVKHLLFDKLQVTQLVAIRNLFVQTLSQAAGVNPSDVKDMEGSSPGVSLDGQGSTPSLMVNCGIILPFGQIVAEISARLSDVVTKESIAAELFKVPDIGPAISGGALRPFDIQVLVEKNGQDVFFQSDQDISGQLDSSEFKQASDQYMTRPFTQEESDLVFTALDDNRDGELSDREFFAVSKIQRQAEPNVNVT